MSNMIGLHQIAQDLLEFGGIALGVIVLVIAGVAVISKINDRWKGLW